MRKVVYHRNAARYMRRMPPDRKEQVKRAVRRAADLPDPLSDPNVKAMVGDWAGCMRLRVGVYRAIFHIVKDAGEELFEVLAAGPRGDIY